jgi:metallopeptidase MepB
MAPDAYRNPPQLPPTFTATPAALVERTKQLIQASRELQDKVVAQVTHDKATFDNVLLPLVHDENKLGDETNVICFYQAVSTDQAVRDASTEAQNLFNEFDIESSTREDVFRLVEAALARKDASLDPESQRLLEKTHRGFIQYGLAIPAGAQRDRFKEIKKRLSQIETTFQKNLNEETGGLWFSLDELEGVPVDVLSGLKRGEAGSEHEGQLWLTFKYPDIFPTFRHAVSADVRRRLFVANENKCPENVPLFREAVVLRDEAARLLGYPNHATFRIEDKMAKTPKTVDDFLGDLRSRLKPGAQREREKLKELKKQDLKSRGEGDKDDGHYFLWDHRFYDRLMIEKNFSIDQQKIAEYFSLQSTVDGMLHIFEQLFGLKFVEITPGMERDKLAESSKGADIVWHEDVTLFSVWNDESEGNGFVGYLYLDLFPRDGKYGHAANFNLQPVRLRKDIY